MLAACYGDAPTRTEVQACLARRDAQAGDALREALAAARDQAVELDRVTAGAAQRARALQDSQGAWATWRQAECWRQQTMLEPGSGAGDAYRACIIALTEARAATLVGQ